MSWFYRNQEYYSSMIELNELAFGKIKAREILGAEPDIDATNNMLEQEITIMLKNLKGKTEEELVNLKTKQIEIEKGINSRPGAMALPQNKIRLFTEYSLRYIKDIEKELICKNSLH